MKALEGGGVKVKGKNVLLLGAGGAARAIAFTLATEGAIVTIANRTPKRAISLAKDVGMAGIVSGCGLLDIKNLIKNSDILINSTAIGMSPKVTETLVTSDLMHRDLVVLDIVYNPLNTRLLVEARNVGVETIDGVMMLVYQGAEAFKIWTGKKPPVDVMEEAVRARLS
jgi:shikimate dehydrogenase